MNENQFLKIIILGDAVRCKYCDCFYLKNPEFYGPAKDTLNRTNEVRFTCVYCSDKGIQKVKVKKVTDDQIDSIDVSEQFIEEIEEKKKMEALIIEMIQEVSKALTSELTDPRHYIDFISNRKEKFDKDFIFSTTLQRPPDPIANLNSARAMFESIESKHCPEEKKGDWVFEALSYLNEVKKQLKYTHRNIY
jgi:hypothetical protein